MMSFVTLNLVRSFLTVDIRWIRKQGTATSGKPSEKVRESEGKGNLERRKKMSSEAKTNGGNVGGGGGGGFRSRMERYLYSGDKKHVMAGIAIISVVFGVPWFLMSRGSYVFLLLLQHFNLSKRCCLVGEKIAG